MAVLKIAVIVAGISYGGVDAVGMLLADGKFVTSVVTVL